MGELKADCTRLLPGGKMDDSTFEQIENALDRIEAPATGPDGRWLTLVERILAFGQQMPPSQSAADSDSAC